MNKSLNRFKLWFDRLLSKSLLRQFAFLAIVLFFLFLLSWFFLHLSGCKWEDFAKESNVPEFLLPLYLLIDTNAFNNLYINGVNGWALFVSSITFIVGAFVFNGAIIAIITNAIEQRVSNHKKGYIHYLKSGHYIIMGYDEMVPSIIAHLFDKDKDAFVLLLSSVDADSIQEKLKRFFPEEQLQHIIINYGHRMSQDYYKDIHLETAEQIYIVGLRTLPAHDAINVECVDSICNYLQKNGVEARPKRIICIFEDLDTYAAFKTTEIFGKVRELGIEFVPYNFYAGWAKQVFVRRYHKDYTGYEINYPAVYGKNGIKADDKRFVHLVFAGFSRFAEAFAMEAANVLHFTNFNEKNGFPRTRISFIDINADKEKDVFIVRNRHFFEIQPYLYSDLSQDGEYKSNDKKYNVENVCFDESKGYAIEDYNFLDVEFEFIKGDVFSTKVQNVIKGWAEDTEGRYLSIFLAMTDQRQNFIFGMNMPDEVYDNEIPVFIRQDRSDNFVSNLREADECVRSNGKKNTYSAVKDGKLVQTKLGGRYANIYPFGMNATAYSADEKSLDRAKLINYLYETADYEQNKFQSMRILDSVPVETIRRDADAYWRKLNVAHKWSSIYNAYTISVKLATLRAERGLEQSDTSQDTRPLSEDEVEVMARTEHNRWNVEKLLMGYRKPRREEDKYFGDNKAFRDELKRNKERFIHHDIRPYEQLDGIEELDKEFSRYIPWIVKFTEKR